MEISFNRGKIHFSFSSCSTWNGKWWWKFNRFFGANAMSKCIPLARFKSLVVFPSVDSVIWRQWFMTTAEVRKWNKIPPLVQLGRAFIVYLTLVKSFFYENIKMWWWWERYSKQKFCFLFHQSDEWQNYVWMTATGKEEMNDDFYGTSSPLGVNEVWRKFNLCLR